MKPYIPTEKEHELLESAHFNSLIASSDALLLKGRIQTKVNELNRLLYYADEEEMQDVVNENELARDYFQRLWARIDHAHDLIRKGYEILDEIHEPLHKAYMDFHYPEKEENEE